MFCSFFPPADSALLRPLDPLPNPVRERVKDLPGDRLNERPGGAAEFKTAGRYERLGRTWLNGAGSPLVPKPEGLLADLCASWGDLLPGSPHVRVMGDTVGERNRHDP